MTMIEMMQALAQRGISVGSDDNRPVRPNRLIYGHVVSTYHSPLPFATEADVNAQLERRTPRNK
jgi:hypothetical protein